MASNLTLENFIFKAKNVHGDKYDYSQVEYQKTRNKILIICPKHGSFEQRLSHHLNGHGCKFCGREIGSRLTKEDFIAQAKSKHGNKYDYSKVEYRTKLDNITIICPKHGSFKQRLSHHLDGRGCRFCGYEVTSSHTRSNTKLFIERAQQIHGEKYDYLKVDYIRAIDKVTIICPDHGEFQQVAMSHLLGYGCEKCGFIISASKNTGILEGFIEKANKIFGDKYDYSKVHYKGINEKVEIICPEHGSFFKTPHGHYCGTGCPKCAKLRMREVMGSNVKEFVERAKEIHDKYDYSKVAYVTARKKVEIICPDHGSFLQSPDNHLRGVGCPICIESKGEKEIRRILTDWRIPFQEQMRFEGCKHKRELPFDFFLPDHEAVIEYHGEQHYREVKGWGGKTTFLKIQIRDAIKKNYCKSSKIKYIEIPYNTNNIEAKIFRNLKPNALADFNETDEMRLNLFA